MKTKRIANEIKKMTGFENVIGEYGTIFTGMHKVYDVHFSMINDIFTKYKVRISAIGIDLYGNIYLDLTEVS